MKQLTSNSLFKQGKVYNVIVDKLLILNEPSVCPCFKMCDRLTQTENIIQVGLNAIDDKLSLTKFSNTIPENAELLIVDCELMDTEERVKEFDKYTKIIIELKALSIQKNVAVLLTNISEKHVENIRDHKVELRHTNAMVCTIDDSEGPTSPNTEFLMC